mmetsp:Transcript_9355/g.13657  ORF Transcript_9355/g.13657 Transcript_9355/m.13657 type:complete len:220 (-) Transcript_9355:1182-1841(-)
MLGFRLAASFEAVKLPLEFIRLGTKELLDASSMYHVSTRAASFPSVAFVKGSFVRGIIREPRVRSCAISVFLFFLGLINATFSSPDLRCLSCEVVRLLDAKSVPKLEDARLRLGSDSSPPVVFWYGSDAATSPPSSFPPIRYRATAAAAVEASISSELFRFAACRCLNCCRPLFHSDIIPDTWDWSSYSSASAVFCPSSCDDKRKLERFPEVGAESVPP